MNVGTVPSLKAVVIFEMFLRMSLILRDTHARNDSSCKRTVGLVSVSPVSALYSVIKCTEVLVALSEIATAVERSI